MSLLDSISGMVTPTMLGGLGHKFGIPEDKLESSMGGITGMLMNSLAGRAGDHSTMEKLSGLVNESPDEHDDVAQLLDAPDDNPMKRRGNQLLDLATGGNPASLTGGLGRFLGIGGGAATGLLGTIASLAMTAFRTLGRTKHLDASSLGLLLHSERDTYRQAIPAPLRSDMRAAIPTHKTSRAWWALLLIPLAALAIWSFQLGHRHAHRQGAQQGPNRPASEAMREKSQMAPPPEEQTPQQRQARPVGGRRVPFAPGTAEDQLLAEARSPSARAPAISLDMVTFEKGTSTLSPAADSQLANVAQVLQQHPDTAVTITGYPDSPGTAEENRALSQARADRVRDALVAKGIDSSRLQTAAQETTGSGPFPRAISIQITGRR